MQGSMIVLGKVMLGEENKQSIISRKDFENWNQYQRLVELFGENLPADLKISSPTFRLDKVLKIINNTRRLRSLTTKEATEIILSNNSLKNKLINYLQSKYIGRGLTSVSLSKTVDIKHSNKIIEEDLRKKNPTWHDDTITRKA
jgi:hypothetical protein